jgi:UDP-GlcNAc:undecaprenyl-phosphate GlcNAc-1-phosphate transferase
MAVLALPLAAAAALALTPAAIATARRTGFYDHPRGYKAHAVPTPYLGGTAVLAAMLLSASQFGRAAPPFAAIALGALALWATGTADDRYSLGPVTRLAVEAAAAVALFAAGTGWSLFSADAANLAFTVLFTVGAINAYNLMDNMDGACGGVAAASGAVLGVAAALRGHPALAATALALSGACAGFLPFNLASPSRVFLGDGGSMPLGFVLAAIVMALTAGSHEGGALVPLAVVLIGLPALDTTLVIVSRLRRGAGVFTGGNDHLTHRLWVRLGSARRVAAAVAAGQATVLAVGVALLDLTPPLAAAGSLALIGAGIAVVVRLESPEWSPAATETST